MSTNLSVIDGRLQPLRKDHRRQAFRALCERLGVSQPPGDWFTVSERMVRQFKRLACQPDIEPGAPPNSNRTWVPPHLVLCCLDAMIRSSSPILDAGSYCHGMIQIVDCGYERINFTAPLLAGTRIRAAQTLTMASVQTRSIETKVEILVEPEDGDSPVCAAERIYRLDF